MILGDWSSDVCSSDLVNSSHEVAKVLEFQLQHHFFQRPPSAGQRGKTCSEGQDVLTLFLTHLSQATPSVKSIPPSIRVFSNESTLHMRWPKYWSFSFSIIPSKEIPGLISFRMDWLDLLAVQGTLKSLLQHHSSKASILWHSAQGLKITQVYYVTVQKSKINFTEIQANQWQPSCLIYVRKPN